MRKVLSSSLLALLAVWMMSSCSSEQRKLKAEQADSLLTTYETISMRMASIDTLAIEQAWKSFQQLSDSFNMYYDDSFHESTWEQSKLFAEIKSPLKFVRRNYSRVHKSLEYSVGQVEDLRKDIRKGRWDDEEVTAYLETERQEMLRIEQEVSLLVQNAELGLSLFTERSGPMRELITTMKADAPQ